MISPSDLLLILHVLLRTKAGHLSTREKYILGDDYNLQAKKALANQCGTFQSATPATDRWNHLNGSSLTASAAGLQ